MLLERFIGFRWLSLPIFLTILVASTSAIKSRKKLNKVFSWESLDFVFPNWIERIDAIRTGSFIPGKLVPIDVDVYHKGSEFKAFVTVPRFQEGVPVTVGYLNKAQRFETNPQIHPYPNWEMQQPGGDCNGITSVFRVAIDTCKRLWIMDTGKLLENQVCPPKLLVYSLENDTLLSSYKIPKDQYESASLHITPVVDYRGSCEDVFVYIADVTGFNLIVYDHRQKQSWKITNDLFRPEPKNSRFEINSESFHLADGLFGLALGPIKNNDRILYFHALASRSESWVLTSVIRNRRTFNINANSSSQSFQAFPLQRSTQSAAEAMDRNGVLFYGLLSDVAIGCWNSVAYPKFGGKNVETIVTNRETLQFPSGMKIVNPFVQTWGGQELWVMTVPFQKVMVDTLNSNVTNFRIQVGLVDELVRDTKCGGSRWSSNNHY